MRCQLHADRTTDVTCGDCGGPICSQCQQDQQDGRWLCATCVRERVVHAEMAARAARPAASSNVTSRRVADSGDVRNFWNLSVLARLLCVLTVVLGCISLFGGRPGLAGLTRPALGILGIVAAVLMYKQHMMGWMLGMLWMLSQVVVVIVDGSALNTQGLFVGVNSTTNGLGLGLNFGAVIGAVLLFIIREEFLVGATSQREALT